MPDNVVDHIHQIAQQQKTNPGLLFADWNLNSVDVDNDVMDNDEEDNEESSDDEDYVPNEYDDGDEESSDDEDYVPNEYDDDESKHEECDEAESGDENNQNEENDVEPMANGTIDINADNNLGGLVGNPGEVMPAKKPRSGRH